MCGCFSVQDLPCKMEIQLHHFSLEISPGLSRFFFFFSVAGHQESNYSLALEFQLPNIK